MGGTSAIYVSQNNIYLTFPDYNWQENETMKTAIQRISIDKQTITPAASGEVPGYLLNQFSMDESNSYFRIATTTNNFGTGEPLRNKNSSNQRTTFTFLT